MSKQTKSNLFISSPLAKYAGLYQRLLRDIGSFQQLGNRLIRLGETAHAFRRFHLVREIGQTLSQLPIKDFQAVGHYFLAVASNSCGKGNQQEARKLFELVADIAPSTYKTKAIQSLAGVSANSGDYDAELYYFNEALKASQDIATTLITHRGIAIHKAREGYHRHALRDLENLASHIKYVSPSAYFDYLNSYAVELEAADRLVEAHNVSNVVLASPFASAYPEWQETLLEIRSKQKQHSIITISRPEIEEHKTQIETTIIRAVDRARVHAAINFMNDNLHRKLKLKDLAKAVHLSRAYFSSLFKAETGYAPIDYLIKLRIEKAGHLLATTFFSVKKIMIEVGYNNKSNFSRYFKTYFNATPSEYREQALAGQPIKDK